MSRRDTATGLQRRRLDAASGDERTGFGKVGRATVGGREFALFDAGDDDEVQVKALLQEVVFGGETVGDEARDRLDCCRGDAVKKNDSRPIIYSR